MIQRLRPLVLIAALALPVGLAAVPARAQDAGEITLRLDRLEAANRQLTGQVEEARNQIKRLEDQLRRMQADVDFRFQELHGGKGSARPPAGGTGNATPGRRSDAFDPAAQPQAPGQPQRLGGATTLPGARNPGDIIADDSGAAPRGPGQPLPLGQGGGSHAAPAGTKIAALPGAASPHDEITLAKGFLQRGDYELAEGQYREFIRTYPHDRLVPDAQFGLAESFFLRQRYQEAAEQYLNLATQHPKSTLAPEGLLKLAMSLRAIGETKQSCGTLAEIGRKYPKSSGALKNAVEREQKRSRC